MLIVLPEGARPRACPIVRQAVRGEEQSFVSLPLGDTYRIEPAPMVRPALDAVTWLTISAHSSARRRRGERAIARGCRSITFHPVSRGNTRGCSRRQRVHHAP